VVPRPNQARLTFQVSAAAAAGQQLVTVNASQGGETVQDTIQVEGGSHPVITVPKDQAGKPGAPVSFAVTAADPSEQPVSLSASNLPAGAAFDSATGRFEWTPVAAQNGMYKVQFNATDQLGQSSSAQVGIDIGSGEPTLAATRNACSPGAIGSVTGSWLAATGASVSDPSGTAIELDGTKLLVNGQYVPLISASATQVQFICPSLPAQTSLELSVETDAGKSGPLNAIMQIASPWVFPTGTASQNRGLVSLVGTTDLAMPRNSELPAHPAQPGDEILILGTGLGSSSGAASWMVSARVGGVDAEVEAVSPVSGHAGVYTVRVRVPVPLEFGDDVPLQLQVSDLDGKLFSSNSVTIAVEPVSQ
jgi:uncharacterized protein (TIGR03437 family)